MDTEGDDWMGEGRLAEVQRMSCRGLEAWTYLWFGYVTSSLNPGSEHIWHNLNRGVCYLALGIM